MSVIKKPDLKIFAQDAKTGEVETFPDILRGWGVTLDRTAGKPPLEWFNAIGKRVDEWLMYLTQRGVAEWDTALSYPKTAIVQFNSVVYVSIKETKGEQPDKSQASWSTLGVFLGLGNYYNKTESDNNFQTKGNYANGDRFKATASNVAMSPIAGAISLVLQTDGTLFTWDGSKSVFRISSAGKITNGSMPYPRLTGVPIVQSTGGSTTSFMSQKATTDAIASAQAAFPEASTTNKGKVQLASNTGQSTSLVMHQKAVTDAIETRQPKGEYADGKKFKLSSTNAAINSPNGEISLVLQDDGTLFTWDGNKSVINISPSGVLTKGSVPYGRLTDVPINTLLSEDNGYWRCKDTGFMIQWGRVSLNGFVNFPIPFPRSLFSFSGVHVGENAVPVRINSERSTLKGIDIAQSTTGQIGMRWIAIGF
ncbi:hypothetical protein AB6G31_21725 [Providencia hangzhouensis]|uniref:gp53-like domain-containing protein n=2 Tax=Providencia hangzhouensis TaxID=3031799 RepID=UPI0034DDC535